LQKNNEPPVKAEIAKDNVTAIFENDDLNVVSDKEIFDSYCKKIEATKEDYLQFIKSARDCADYAQFKRHAYFGMYVKEFEESTEFKKLKSEKISKAFYDYVLSIEKEKLYYFALIYKQHTLVVTAPSDNAEQETFLGYSWSNRKGDEGIKIKSSTPQNACGLLYNVYDEENSIARFVKDAFLGIYRSEGQLQKYVNSYAFKDMIDFGRTSFDKAIKCNAKIENGELKIESKWPLVKLGEIAEIVRGVTFDKTLQTTERTKNIVLTADNITLDGHFALEKEIFVSETVDFENEKKLRKNDCFMCFSSGSRTHVGKVALIEQDTDFYAGGFMGILRAKNNTSPRFLYEMLNTENIRNLVRFYANGTNILNLSNSIGETKLPLPPLDVQKSIVAECEKIDGEYQQAQNDIADCKAKITKIIANETGVNKKLKDICDMKAGKFVSADDISPIQKEGMYPCFGGNGLRGYVADFTHDGVYPLVGRQGALCGNVCMATGKFHATEHAVAVTPKENIDVYWLRYQLEFMNLNQYSTGTAQPGLSVNKIVEVSCTVPPLDEQQKIVSKITALESKITDAKKVMEECPAKKQAILDKWLK
ncbi:MAG: restriction endonuclease subunit S, partial [Treponema sp.]|nr:restriction endonuclease subunit S [Treponema sp.]